jgi:hypothetical protein
MGTEESFSRSLVPENTCWRQGHLVRIWLEVTSVFNAMLQQADKVLDRD